MFSRPGHRAVSLLVLASYLAAGTLGMLWHEHLHPHAPGETCTHVAVAEHFDHDDHAEHDHAAHGNDHDTHDHHTVAGHEHDAPEHKHHHSEPTQNGSHTHSDDCSVCRLLGERTLPTLAVTPASITWFCEFVEPAAVASPTLAVLGIAHSRAPPSLG